MLARKEHNQNIEGQEYAKQWIDQISRLLQDIYAGKCEANERSFSVFGFNFADETLMIVSFQKEDDSEGLPVSIFVSADIDSKNPDEKILKSMVDFLGLVIDDMLPKVDGDSDDLYSLRWEEHEFDKKKLYLKVTRENVELTLQATRLLNQ